MNLTEYCLISLNMPDNNWISFSDYAKVLKTLPYSYSNIIVASVIMLEFLSARFIHQAFCDNFIVFNHELEHNSEG